MTSVIEDSLAPPSSRSRSHDRRSTSAGYPLARSPITIAKEIFTIQDTGKPRAELTIAPNSVNCQPPAIPAGILSQLLDRRLDIAGAERRVARFGKLQYCGLVCVAKPVLLGLPVYLPAIPHAATPAPAPAWIPSSPPPGRRGARGRGPPRARSCCRRRGHPGSGSVRSAFYVLGRR